ncbi:hypothetical protein CHGG_01551 [Chaetomium globosum CBS 148.51]|uniref:Uncharacterized protein n=1 Tax=Chaetomium globosum (strain ATCC 6205 / CBS 148.51 / DSM 1962 / NBRC 6347 / NRRL 1970) TaxID=306901 RepID=Q2HE03_CHAGB|nr:uncharacterized protein CHGG_01551 [Chaetomium globosum CBS 148.51]EAQ93316.1 hypothetical protein CHGG_01551 [Chaetomium globosum CBS 148.51]
MRDEMKSEKLDEERDRWVDSLDDGEICRLASSFHHGDPCTIFRPRKRGGFNVCFFIEFESTSERWVVRIPIPVMVPKAVLDEKTEIELATMRYVSAKTTIPIPRVHAYAFSDTGLNGLPFIIMDYIDGQNLKALGFGGKDSSHTFGEIGRLEGPQTPTANPEEIGVYQRPLSVEISDQELDGLEPAEVFPPKRTFSTAREFVNGLLWLANNKLEKERDQALDDRAPDSVLYAAHHFKQFIQDEWLDQSANKGPFVLALGYVAYLLVHGDMDIVIGNVLFDQDYKLVGVLDWEWSRVVPGQLMMPPIWLNAGNIEFVMLAKHAYCTQVAYLRQAVQEREKALGLPPLLSTQWAASGDVARPNQFDSLTSINVIASLLAMGDMEGSELGSLVMDKYNIVGDVGAAIHLSPNVTRILPRWGIKTENLEPSLMSRYVERTKGGDVIKDVDLTVPNARWGYPRQMVHRPALHRELKRVATSAEGVGEPVEFLPKHRVVDVKPHVGVHMDSGVLVSADVFIGADGIKSKTREAIKQTELFRTGKAAFRFLIPSCLVEFSPETESLGNQKDTLTTWFADDRRIVMYPCQNNEWLNFVCIYPDPVSETLPNHDWGRAATREEVLNAFSDFDERLLTLFRKADKTTIKAWQLLDMETLPTWTSSKLALMGDAAHPCLPYQAQGGAQAIEDAAALAAVLPMGTEPHEVPERLKLYEAIRSERAGRIQEYSRLTGKDWVNGAPVYDMRAFEEYNFNHDEMSNSASAFKTWLDAKLTSMADDELLEQPWEQAVERPLGQTLGKPVEQALEHALEKPLGQTWEQPLEILD